MATTRAGWLRLRTSVGGGYLFVAVAPALCVIVLAVVQPWVSPRLLFMDPSDAARIASGAHLGMLSNAGVMFTVLAGVAALAALWGHRGRLRASCAAALVAVLSACIAMDDFFQWHEVVLPSLGVPELVIEALYCLAGAAAWMLRRAWMNENSARVLLLALAFLGASVGIDLVLEVCAIFVPVDLQARLVTPEATTVVVVTEDSAKFIGLWLWALCHVAAVRAALRA